ncbi:MAG: DUF3040 domain-containing protein [Desmonostoc vinosum HA7617-LM4]|jgi:hypothetical protein|nr:DUF3040 domain-containing protein [Desmonostoc vinosum HA7617-LM4]
MTSQNDRHEELEQRERLLRQREMELRLREMEAKIHDPDAPFYQTVKHQQPNSQKPWMKKFILGAKLIAIGVTVLIAVRIAAILAGIIIVAALTFVSYKLFFDSQINTR